MTWILMAAVAVAAFFYGRYQQAQAAKWRTEALAARVERDGERLTNEDRRARYEEVIANTKARLKQLEDYLATTNDPAAVRDLFGRLFPPTA